MKLLYRLSLLVLFIQLSSCKEKNLKDEPSVEDIRASITAVQPFAKDIFSQFTNIRDFTISTDEN